MKKLSTIAATLTACAGFSHGAALSLDGVGDFVEFVGTGVPVGNSPFTIGAWINPASIPAGGGNGGQITFWGTQGPANAANGFRLRGEAGTRHYFWGNDHDENFPGGSILGDTTGPNGDGWHHLAVTFDGNQTVQYWNGAPLGNPRAAAGVNVATDATHRIGSRLDAEFFDGFIDELSIWSVALGADDIAAGWNLPVDYTNPAIAPALVAYWNFDGGPDDLAGGDNTLTFQGDSLIDAGVNAPLIPEPSAAIFGALGTLILLRRRRR